MVALDVAQAPALGEGLGETLAPLGKARHAPGYLYGSPEIFAIEKEKIFMCEWLCMARAEEIAVPGDYMTFRVMGEPLIVTRNNQDEVRAFANVCAHRGVEVASGAGNTQEFSCPYHGWLYDLDGKLVGAPYMKEAEGFDPARCRLKPLHCELWGGWVFVNFADRPVPFDDFTADFRSDFGFLQPENCRIGHKFTIDWDCNWKFIIENLMDVYHFGTVHAESFAHMVPDPDKYRFNKRARGGISSFYSGGSFTTDGKSLVGPMPWLADRPEDLGCLGVLPPNFHILARRDFVRPYLTWPESPSKTQAVIYHLFAEEHMRQPGFEAKAQAYFDWYQGIAAEDIAVIQALQHIAGSTWFRGERMSLMESPIHHFISGVIRRLYDDRPQPIRAEK